MTNRREQFRAVFLATVMVVSMVAMGATALAGSAAADVEEENIDGDDLQDAIHIEFGDRDGSGDNTIDNVQPVLVGSDDQELPRLDIVDDVGGVIDDEITITLPDGVSFNPDATDISLSGEGPELDGDVSFEDSNQQIVIPLDGTSSEDERVSISGMVLAVDADIDFDGTNEVLEAEIATDDGSDDFEFIEAFKNELSGGETSVPADGTAELDDGLEIVLPDDGNFQGAMEPNKNLPVAEGTDVVISPNATAGISFDVDETDLDAVDITINADDGDFDVENIDLTEGELRIPVNESFGFHDGTAVEISDGLAFAAEPDADDTSDVSMMYEPTNATGTVDAVTDYNIEVDNPNLDLFGDEDEDSQVVAAGVENQVIDTSGFGDGVPITVSATDDGQIIEGQNVTIASNSSDISFAEENEDLTVEGPVDGGVDDIIHVDDDILTFNITEDVVDGEIAENDEITVGATEEQLTFNVSSDVEDEEIAGFELQTGDDGAVISEPENDNTLTAERVDVDFIPDVPVDFIPVDNAGHSGLEADLDIVAPDADSQDPNGDDIVVAEAGTNMTIDLEDAGVTFDQRMDLPGTLDESSYEQELPSDISSGDDVTEFYEYNVTADADDTEIDVGLNNTFTETEDSTTAETEDAIADIITANNEEDVFEDTVTAGEPEPVSVEVLNDSADINFGGADVDLELIDSPADVSADDVLNTTSLTTSANDFAEDDFADAAFNFTGTAVGHYSVNATIEDGDNVLINHTVEAADPDQFDVEGEDNAFRAGGLSDATGVDDGNEHRVGVYNVTVADEFGSPVEDSSEFDFEIFDVHGTVLGVTDEINDGVPNGDTHDASEGDTISADDGEDIEVSDGHFYVLTASSTPQSTHDASISVAGVSDTPDLSGDSGEVTFFDRAENADLDLGEGSLNLGDHLIAEATIEDDEGNIIEVPRIDTDFEVSNDTVADFVEFDDETDRHGIVTANISADEIGETDVTVEFDDAEHDRADAEATETLEVTDVAADFQITEFDDVEITEGDEATVDVEVTNEGDAEGTQEVVVEVDGEDISATEEIEELSPDDSETVSLDLNTEDLDADDYDMTAMTDDDTANATLTVEEPVVELDVTLDDLTIDEGENTDIDVDVENTGDLDAEDVDVELDIDDGEITVDDTVDVDAGDTETVTFEDVETEDLDADEYDMEATATHDDDDASDTATLTIEEDDEGIPGFTAGIAALALLGAALLALRLRNEE